LKRREKAYSLEEDLALEQKRAFEFGPTLSCYKIERLEEYDPGGKRAHAIAEKIRREDD